MSDELPTVRDVKGILKGYKIERTTREEMRERLEKAIRKLIKPQHPQQVANIADAAIAIIRGETLEEAARVIENDCHDDMTRAEEAAAIRALKDKP